MRRAVLVGLVLASVAVPAAAQRDSSDADQNAIQRVFDTYLQSVKTADLAIAGEVWSRGADVIAVTPFGRFEGWDNVRDAIYVNFLQRAFSERKLEPSNVAIHAAGDSGWLVFDWTFTGKMSDGQAITSKGWESQVYRRTPAGWRIVALHYSVPPPPPPR
jgi:ketosteroid isomerase-like protein